MKNIFEAIRADSQRIVELTLANADLLMLLERAERERDEARAELKRVGKLLTSKVAEVETLKADLEWVGYDVETHRYSDGG